MQRLQVIICGLQLVCMCVHTIYMIPKATTIKQLLRKLNETEEKLPLIYVIRKLNCNI